MIGTRLDDIDEPRLIPGKHGWWFIGNQTWTLLSHRSVGRDGTLTEPVREFLRNSGALRLPVPTSYSLTVLTTTACNLACGYCFQNVALEGARAGVPARIRKKNLRSADIDKIMDFSAGAMSEADLDSLFLLIFGGEPLLRKAMCIEMLQKARRIGMSSAIMTTNGVLLCERTSEALSKNGLTGVQITFDGDQGDHDRIRLGRTGEGTFDVIVANLKNAIAASDLSFNLRINVSHVNFGGVDGLIDRLVSAGFDRRRCTVSFAWVGDAGFGYENRLPYGEAVKEAVIRWTVSSIEAGFNVARPGMKSTCQICSVPGGRYGAVINADGSLYSCWQSAGKEGFRVGDIDAGYGALDDCRDRWVQCGYDYKQDGREGFERFQDDVDAGVLDYLYESDRL